MYKCDECNEIFQIPEKARPDAGVMYYPGHITRFNIPLVSMCPVCRSTNITKQGIVSPFISVS